MKGQGGAMRCEVGLEGEYITRLLLDEGVIAGCKKQ